METLAASDTCSNRKFSKHRHGFSATDSPMCLESQEMVNEVFFASVVGDRRGTSSIRTMLSSAGLSAKEGAVLFSAG